MSLREDLRAVPDEVRSLAREGDQRLREKTEERPVLAHALDFKVVLGAAAIAFVVALLLTLIGLPSMLSIVIFLILFGVLWWVLARAAAPRRATERARHTEGAQPLGHSTAQRAEEDEEE
jgi:Flp pilus assembly protein TadB